MFHYLLLSIWRKWFNFEKWHIPALKINCPAILVMLMQKQLLLVLCINLFFSTLLTPSAEWRKCQRIKGPNPRTQKATTLESPPLVPFCCWLDWRHFTRKSLEKSAAFRLLRQPPTQTSCVLTHGSMWYWKPPPNEFARAELMTHTITVGQAWKQPWHRFGIGTSELTNSAHTLERPKNSWIPKLFHLSVKFEIDVNWLFRKSLLGVLGNNRCSLNIICFCLRLQRTDVRIHPIY